MKKTSIIYLITFLLISLPLYAQDQVTDKSEETVSVIPSKISYQGVLTDNNGIPLNEPHNLTFRLYTSSTGGIYIWEDTQLNVPVNNGIFNVYLGSDTSLNDLAFDVPYWLEITVNGTTLTPRIELSSSAYSFNTSRIQGNLVSSDSPSNEQVLKWNGYQWAPGPDNSGGPPSGNAGGDLTGTYPDPTIADNVITSNKILNGTITTDDLNFMPLTNPFQGTLVVNGGIDVDSIDVGSGRITAKEFFSRRSYLGMLSNSGVWIDIDHDNNGNEGFTISSENENKTYISIREDQNGSERISINTAAMYGSYPIYIAGDTRIAGNLSISGNISKGTGSFEIDHPLDPENKILRHSFVESPDMMNVYNGNITTDASGYANVQLPDYFEALNKDFRYQLTVVGQFAQAIVSQEIQNKLFTIQTDKPNVKVSWQVTGIRKDPWAEKNLIVVEEQKSAETKGYYLNPEAYNLPKTRSLEWALHPETMMQIEEKSGEE